ncbi:MAG: 3-hydroxyacyl-ACP dehydratase FabZ [Firmicutes bacterium]|nr:3-hydroxyacyl-ACP dehydratase FabZ [Bacillota bacterium]
MLSIDEIYEKLPHRYPFLMVDKVLELEEGKRIVAIKNVTINEPFFQGHYPQLPVMPGVMIIEAMAQVGGLAVGGSADSSTVPLLAAVERARFKRMVRPGDQLIISADVLAQRAGVVKVQAVAKVEQDVCAQSQLTFMLAKRGDVVGRV